MNNCNWWEPFLLVACPRVDFQKLTDHSQDCVAACRFFQTRSICAAASLGVCGERELQAGAYSWVVGDSGGD